jgi:hypothetical protein
MAITDYLLGVSGSERKLSANDADLDQSVEDLVNETRLAGGALVRYKRAKKLHFRFRYEYLYGKDRDVYDGGMGRNSLYALYMADGVMNLIAPDDQSGQLTYSVRFAASTWNESLVFRSGDVKAWRLSFELVEI